MFSMGFRSGLSGGVGHQLILFSARKVLAHLEVCFGSLSCINRWTGSFSLMNGTSVLSRMPQ